MSDKSTIFYKQIDIFLNTFEKTNIEKETLYRLWNHIAMDSGSVPIIRNRILDTIRSLRHMELPNFLGQWDGNFYPPENMRQLFYNWKVKRSLPKDDTLVSFLVLLIMLKYHGKSCFSPLCSYFESNSLSLEDLCFSLYTLIYEHSPETDNDYNNQRYLADYQLFSQTLQASEKHLTAFLLAGFVYCRHMDQCQKKKSDISFNPASWLEQTFRQLEQSQANQNLTSFKQKYFELLWNENKILTLRDAPGTITPEYHKHELASLYVVPTLRDQNGETTYLFDKNLRFSYLITANSGAGKSSLLQALVVSCLYPQLKSLGLAPEQNRSSKKYEQLHTSFRINNSYFPVLVKACTFNLEKLDAERKYKLLDFASGSSSGSFESCITELLQMANDSGTLLLLVDALDELDEEHASIFSEMIDDFLSQYPNVNLIITSRLIHFRDFKNSSFFTKTDHLTLDLFDDNKIIQFITNWIRQDVFQAGSYDWKELKSFFSKYPHLYALIKNPYMLSHAIYYKINHQDAQPEDLISYIIDNMIEKRWPEKKYGIYGITSSYMRGLLSCIAWEMAKSDQHYIAPSKLVKRFRAAGEQYDEDVELDAKTWNTIANEMNTQAGILAIGSPDTERTELERENYVFQLNVIEHFLAAEWIRAKLRDTFSLKHSTPYQLIERVNELLPDVITQKHWQEIILMLFYPVSELHAKTRESDVTSSIFKMLLYRSAETISEEELTVIGAIFVHLLRGTLGSSSILNPNASQTNALRLQMLRVLSNIPSLQQELAELDKHPRFQEDRKTLMKLKLIRS